MNDGIRRM